jgi:hypothetical protein
MSSPTPMTVYDGCISRERMSRDWARTLSVTHTALSTVVRFESGDEISRRSRPVGERGPARDVSRYPINQNKVRACLVGHALAPTTKKRRDVSGSPSRRPSRHPGKALDDGLPADSHRARLPPAPEGMSPPAVSLCSRLAMRAGRGHPIIR